MVDVVFVCNRHYMINNYQSQLQQLFIPNLTTGTAKPVMTHYFYNHVQLLPLVLCKRGDQVPTTLHNTM